MLQNILIFLLAILLTILVPGGGKEQASEGPSTPPPAYEDRATDESAHEAHSVGEQPAAAAEEPGEPTKAVVLANHTVMHAAPDGQSPSVGQLAQGAAVTVLSKGETWWQVEDDQGRVGYVRAFLLSPSVRRSGPQVMGYLLLEEDPPEADSLRTYHTDMTAVVSWMWQVEPDGTLTADFPLSATAAALTFAGRQGLSTHAMIHNYRDGAYDAGLASRILTNPQAWEELVAQLLRHTREWGLDGVQVNFENVPNEHRDAFTRFVAYLATHLRPHGLQISVSIPARTHQTPAAWYHGYDEAALSREVDFLVVRAYDQHRPGGPAGPIAGIHWVREVLAYLKEQGVPPSKLVLGLAAYGYDWPQDPRTQEWAQVLTYGQVMDRLHQAQQDDPQVTVEWDPQAQVPYFRYKDRIVYFENADSLSHKLALAREEKLAGVALWRLDQEDPDVWAAVDFYLANWSS